jgi:hypothetical protein
MSLLDGPKYTPAPVPVAGAIGRWTAAKTGSGLAIAGGEVVLVPEYVVFTPWDMTQTRDLLVKLLSGAGVPHVGAVDKLLTASKLLEPVAILIATIAELRPLGRASVPRPPYARITFGAGRHFELAILAGPRYPNFSQENNVAFDDWFTKLSAQMNHAPR